MVEIIQMNISEPLYLLKEGTNEVFVNNCQLLKQHQINGLRFLFLQFKKKRQGVIVNFPSHCGKSVMVTLFLHAVRNLLKKPALILCKHEDEMYIWKEYFSKWTDFNDDDIVVESAKVLKGKKIFIKKAEGLASYQKHSWSIIIIKDDSVNKELSQISDADYKIWITSMDVKKDLTMLSFIYNWMYPKSVVNVKDFIPSTKKPQEMLQKSIYLDSFLEDIVIREDNIKQFDKTKKSTTSTTYTNQNNENKLKKSRKNKDETGTKIKRSRRIIDDDDITIPNKAEIMATNNHIQNENFVVNNSDRCNEIKVNDIVINDLNNDSIQFDDKSIIGDSISYHRRDLVQNSTAGTTSDIETKMDMDLTEQMNFRDAIDEIVIKENIIQMENSTESFDSQDNKIVTNVDLENIQENMNINANDPKQHILYNNSTNIMESEQNINIVEEKSMEIKENMEKVTDFDKTNESVNCQNNVDAKLSELEERTMKKFKGSLLDSIF